MAQRKTPSKQRTAASPFVELTIEQLYEESRKIAHAMFRNEPRSVSFSPTSIVHSVLADEAARGSLPSASSPLDPTEATHLLRRIRVAIRNKLIDRARGRRAGKRGGNAKRVELDEAMRAEELGPAEIAEIHDLTEHLMSNVNAMDRQQAEAFTLQFFHGLTVEEVAAILEIPMEAAKTRARRGREWIAAQMRQQSGEG